MSNNISPISFRGIRIEGSISGQNVKKAGDFLSQVENINFIEDIEKRFGSDIVLKGDMTEMSFCHQKYGNLFGKYGCPWFSTKNFFKDVIEMFSGIKRSITIAEKDYAKSAKEYNKIRRGC